LPDWNLLAQIARAEGVAPLAYWRLRQAGWLNVAPESIRTALEHGYATTAMLNMLRTRELGRILDALEQVGVPAIVLKGAALAGTLYPNVALRPMSDLDLMVPRQQMKEAIQAVKSLGYERITETVPKIAPWFNKVVGKHVQLRGGPHQGVVLELHWDMVVYDSDRRQRRLAWFWEQTESFDLSLGSARCTVQNGQLPERRKALTLTPKAHILCLSIHVALHYRRDEERLLWFYDLYLLISQTGDQFDWDQLLSWARELGWFTALYLALHNTQDYFSVALPAGLLEDMRKEVGQQVVQREQYQVNPGQTRTTLAWNSWISMDWLSRIRLVLATAFPSPAYLRWTYHVQPAWLWPLFYFVRWLDILRDGLLTAVQAMRSKKPLSEEEHPAADCRGG